MKQTISFTVVALSVMNSYGQSHFELNAAIAPKLSVNSNTSAISSLIYQNNEADGKFAFGFTYDYYIAGAYHFAEKNRVSVGIGKFNVMQKVSPSLLLGRDFKAIYKRYYFLQIPILYERQVYQKQSWKVYGGLGVTFVADVLYPKLTWQGNLRRRNGDIAEGSTYWYRFNHLNMETFNPLLSATVRTEYRLNKHFTVSACFEAKQGFRPLITSITYFDRKNPDGSSAQGRVLSINNGQCVLLNIGLGYRF